MMVWTREGLRSGRLGRRSGLMVMGWVFGAQQCCASTGAVRQGWEGEARMRDHGIRLSGGSGN